MIEIALPKIIKKPNKRWKHVCFRRFLRCIGYHDFVQNIISFCIPEKSKGKAGMDMTVNIIFFNIRKVQNVPKKVRIVPESGFGTKEMLY